jgi:hypothetical protein
MQATHVGIAVAALTGALAWVGPAAAQSNFVIAGTLYVDLRATNPSAGTAIWTNAGVLGHFTRFGSPTLVQDVAGTGIPGVWFNGTSDYYRGPTSVPDLEGSSDRSVEVWVLNPTIADEETLVAWARRGGPDGSNFSINYGTSLLWGEVGHWGGNTYDMGWPSSEQVPAAGQWHHFVYTYDGDRTCRFYVDGRLVSTKIQATPLLTYSGNAINLGVQNTSAGAADTSGRMLSGYINTVRVHGGVLSPADVAANYAYGPAWVPPTGPVAVTVQPQDQITGEGASVQFRVQATGALPISYQWYREGQPIAGETNRTLTLTELTLADNAARFSCVVSNYYNGTPYTATSAVATLTVRGIGAMLRHRYNFASNANDLVGTAHGVLTGGATIAGGELVLNGSSAFVDLPNNLVTGFTSITIEMWVTDNGSGAWARLFDFGNSTGGEGGQGSGTQYMFLSLPSGYGNLRGAYTVGGGGAAEQLLEWPGGRPPVGQKTHIVWATDGLLQQGRLYVNGVQVGANNAMSLTPAALGPTVNNWIGKSQFSADAYFNGRFDELRIYAMALPPAKVIENYQLGPDIAPTDGPVRVVGQPSGTTAVENAPATFSAVLDGRPPFRLQWFKNGAPIPGATNLTLVFNPTLADDQALIQLWVTNTVDATDYFAASSHALLRVVPDTEPPVLVRAWNWGTSRVKVLFNEPISLATATNLAHYRLVGPAGSVALSSASLEGDGSVVVLSCAPLELNQSYTIAVTNLEDRAAVPNRIVPGSSYTFVALPFQLLDVGAPEALSQVQPAQGGYDVTAGGTGCGGISDQFSFGFEERTGDFDLAVRLNGLSLSDVWARAGLMARDGLATNAAFAAVWATPGPAGCFFQWRSRAALTSTPLAGSFPVNHPYTWLRLRRLGNLFEGFAGIDGQNWMPLGAATVLMPDTVHVGLAVSAHSTNLTTTASFRDYGPGTGNILTNMPLPFEPMAPCSRKTGLVISEIMYHPPDAWGTDSLEFVELHNPDLFAEDLSGFRLAGDIQYTFPTGTRLVSGGYLVVANNPAAVEAFYGIRGVLGPYTNNLPNEGGVVRLINDVGGIVLEINYDDAAPWPVAADGTGHSLVLRRPSYGENDPRAWGHSDRIGGSPGGPDGWGPEPLRAVVINEFLANSDAPGLLDFIELYNASTAPVDLGGAWLSDDPRMPKFQIPAPLVLPPGGWVSFDQTQLGFALSADGDEIVLWNPDRTRVIEAVRFGAQAPNVSRGRWPDGAPLWSELGAPSPGARNTTPLVRDIVINEIMYHPITESNDDEYIELYNRSSNTVWLAGWRLAGGVTFSFPTNAVVPPGGYVVVAENVTNLLAKYPHLTPANTFGNYAGALSDRGERIALEMPLVSLRTNAQGRLVTNVAYVTVCEVTYRDGGRWGNWSDGGGSSLELIDPRADPRFAANWADSDETAKAPWTVVEFTGMLDNSSSQSSFTPNRFEILMQGAGECLIDDLDLRSGANTNVNLILNGGFEGGATNWFAVGTHRRSFVESGVGTGGSRALHVVAVDRGDPGPNKVWTRISTMPTSTTGTIRARVRWLKGSPYCLLRVRGQWIEAQVEMTVPANLGTPGLPNSRWVSNAGPAIAEVTHTPVLPAAGQPVVVTARLDDPDGLSQVALHYRLDPAQDYVAVPMHDDGTGGDALAGDGLWSATLPGQPAGTLVAFYLSATDAATPAVSSRFPNDAPARECLVRFGEPQFPGVLATYRFWLTQDTIDTWAARERNSNEPLDCTFAWGNWRVIYNVGTLYSASPWHTANHPYTGPLGRTCDYELNFPKDDQFLGARDFVLAAQGETQSFFDNDLTGQAEDTCYWFGRKLGLAYNHKRTVRLVVNGQRRGMIYFDHQQPNGDYLDEYFAQDRSGKLFKIEDWFEFDDVGNGFEVQTARLLNYTTTGGVKKTARYRYNFRPRAVTGSPNDFSDLFLLVDAVSAPAPEPYTSAVLNLADIEEWMRLFALEHAVGNWDSYGYRRGKNCYAYKPTRGRWQLLLWDIELVLGKQSDGPTHPLFDLGSAGAADQYEPTIAAMYNHPPFVRAFWRALSDLVNGPMQPEQYWPRMLERYQALAAHGLPIEHPASLANWINARRSYILSQIPAAQFTVGAPDTFETTNATLVLTGTAPVLAQQILVNGKPYPVSWVGSQTAPNGWRLRIPLEPGTNQLVVSAVDSRGTVLGERVLTINFTGPAVSPVGLVVFNEIMYNPAIPGTAFLELFNGSPDRSFDLSGWRIEGLGFTFPAGSIITNQQYLLLTQNRFAHAAAYGPLIVPLADFPGELDSKGEVLSLIKPGPTPEQDLVVDRVRYDNEAPWPQTADGQGWSLQLVDAAQDNARVSNWSDGRGWRFFSFTGNSGAATGTRLSLYFESTGGDVYLDDMALVMHSGPWAGVNILSNGGFELPLGLDTPAGTNNWMTSAVTVASEIVPGLAHSGTSCLHLVYAPAGAALTRFYQDLAVIIPTQMVCTLSFWYLPGTKGTNLTLRFNANFRPVLDPSPPAPATPGAPNSVVAPLPPYPPLWLNEVQPENVAGPVDGAGDRDPWIELYNVGDTPVILEGYYLSDNYSNLTQWAFPAGAVIQPGQFLIVWADGQPQQTSGTEYHTSFRLAPGTGSVALARLLDGAPQILDYFNYADLSPGHSYGSVPDGQPFYRQVLFLPTPGSTNLDTLPPVVLYINEWMAANNAGSGIADPADGDYDDWFELFNPGPVPVNLEGYYLSDSPASPLLYRVPAGYVVPAGGFLLVWADNELAQNRPDQPDLHVPFRLNQAGEAIVVSAPDGRVLDMVSFGPQTVNVSEGRYPDGASARYFMTTPTPRAPNVIAQPPEPPVLSSVSIQPGGTITFSVNTRAGFRYQVQFKNDLNESAWTALGPVWPGTGGPITITDDPRSSPQRFYRVVILP